MRNSEAFSMFVLSITVMETCRDPWRPLLVCQSDFQLLLRAGREAVLNCNNWSFLDLYSFFLSLFLSHTVLYSLLLQISYAVVELFLTLLVET